MSFPASSPGELYFKRLLCRSSVQQCPLLSELQSSGASPEPAAALAGYWAAFCAMDSIQTTTPQTPVRVLGRS